MIPAFSFLCSYEHVPVGTGDYAVVLQGALAVERQIAAQGISVMITDDAWTYRRIIERATDGFKNAEAVPSVLPLMNRHVDPICRAIRPEDFFALVGTRPERPAPLLATATGCRYGDPIRALLVSRLLWADRPEIHAPFKVVTVEGDDPALDRDEDSLHCGSTWVDIEYRGKGLGKLMARLNVMCAWLKFGAWPVFGTTQPGKHFHSKRMIGRCVMDGEPGDIILFTNRDIVEDAQSVLAPPPPITA